MKVLMPEYLDYVDMEISIGDYVLTGGEIPAMIVTDAITRLVPGVFMMNQEKQTHFKPDFLNTLNIPNQKNIKDISVPEILLSGHHANIEEWRHI
jgi:tRNA (guanine37-N1)-methyltransferase